MSILGLGLATPGKPIPQPELCELAGRYNAVSPAQRARIERIYRGSKVAQRHSVLSQNAPTTHEQIEHITSFFGDPADAQPPGTQQRMTAYAKHAPALAAQACRRALDNSRTDPASITHLVTVSCTGFHAPGLDHELIDRLQLDPSVSRTHLGFMGCHGAINGLRVADAFAQSEPDHRVLLCCAELCTLHFQHGCDPQDAVANAIFADGAAAAIGAPASSDTITHPAAPRISAFHSEKIRATQDMMSWAIGNQGFQMRLGKRVPEIVKDQLADALGPWLARHQLTLPDIAGWGIHPGGPRIIDATQSALGLTDDATTPSRAVLRDFGNMSSPTVLFILDQLMRASTPRPWVVLGFGPGLVIEALLIA